MFFDDEVLVQRKRATLNAPPIPETGWRPPQYFPNLDNASVISFDTETKETDFENGPGWARGKGHIVGFSVAAIAGNERGKWYFPIRHEAEPEWNLDPKQCLSWLKHTLAQPMPKVGANLIYDVGWLGEEGIEVKGELHDVQFAEAILDDRAFVALEILGQKYLGRGKEVDILYTWLAQAFGGPANSDARANIYRAPPRLVGPYGEADADLPLDVIARQWPLLAADSLLPLYRMECRLIPLLVAMRRAGVSIDVPAAEQLYGELARDITALYKRLFEATGVNVESVNSSTALARIFDAAGIPYLRTAPSEKAPNGNPSFQKEWLKSLHHPIADIITDIRAAEMVRGTFVKGSLLESNVNGKVYGNFHPLRAEKNGTRVGRFASSNPNLQNIPVRTEIGKKVRRCFIPDQGHISWRKIDYSQIQYRGLAHYAVGPGSDDLRTSYINNPKTDYHDIVQRNVKLLAGVEIERRPIKNINFGLIFGQGEPSLAYKAGFSKEQAKAIFAAYHTGAPYVKPTMKFLEASVQRLGYTLTITGRRVRFDQWEPSGYENRGIPLPYNLAIRNYGPNIERAFAYRGLACLLQGVEGDIIKASMLRCWEEGVFAVTGVPRLQVHDELGFSRIDASKSQVDAYDYMTYCMENTLKLRVPIIAESYEGNNWGVID